jgi:hypothetical protein
VLDESWVEDSRRGAESAPKMENRRGQMKEATMNECMILIALKQLLALDFGV